MAWVFVENYYQRNLANKIDGKADFHYRGVTLHSELPALLQHGTLTHRCMAHMAAIFPGEWNISLEKVMDVYSLHRHSKMGGVREPSVKGETM